MRNSFSLVTGKTSILTARTIAAAQLNATEERVSFNFIDVRLSPRNSHNSAATMSVAGGLPDLPVYFDEFFEVCPLKMTDKNPEKRNRQVISV